MMETKLAETYEINKQYDEFKGIDAVRLLIMDGAMNICISLSKISSQEVEQISQSPFELCFKTFGILGFFILNFNGIVLDSFFDPFKTKDDLFENAEDKKEIQLKIFIAESDTGELLKTRVCGLPRDFSIELANLVRFHCEEQKANYSPAAFRSAVDWFYGVYSLADAYLIQGSREIQCWIPSGNEAVC